MINNIFKRSIKKIYNFQQNIIFFQQKQSILNFVLLDSLFLEKQSMQEQYQKIRRKYPQKIYDLSTKTALLQQSIQKFHFSQFQNIYKQQHPHSTQQNQKHKKVLDQTDGNQIVLQNQDNTIKKTITQVLKIVVQAYEKNPTVNQKYSFQNFQQMVEKAKTTFKDLIKMDKQDLAQQNLNNKIATKNQQNNKPSMQRQQNLQKKTYSDVKNTIKNQSITKAPLTVQKTSKPFQKPNQNILFVKKQAPISEKNIFKGSQVQNRPSSRLLSKNTPRIQIQKPFSPKNLIRQNNSNQSPRKSREKSPTVQNNLIAIEAEKIEEKKSQIVQEVGTLLDKPNQNKEIKRNQVVQIINSSERSHVQFQQQDQQDHPEKSTYEEIKLSSPQQRITSNIQNKSIRFESNNNSIVQLPAFKLSSQRPPKKKSSIESILTNPYIKKTFNHLCKQSYIGGGKTFDQIAQSADIMTLNKWMVFCKQFDFLSKLKKKQLVDIFQHSTQNKPQMNQKQFLDALIIVQNKLRVDEEDFIRKNMCLDSDFAFRQKIATFKVNYAGPKLNFFKQATIKPLQKYYNNLRQQNYRKQRQKQKQIILLQGKFKEHMENELLERKNKREIKKSSLINSQLLERKNKSIISASIDLKRDQRQILNSPYLNNADNKSALSANKLILKEYSEHALSKVYLSRKMNPLTYTEIFKQKDSIMTRAFTTDNKTHPIKSSEQISKPNEKSMSIINCDLMDFSPITEIQSRKPNKSEIIKHEKESQTRPQRQWMKQMKHQQLNLDYAESEESDEILREHLTAEKGRQNRLGSGVGLVKEESKRYGKQERYLEHNRAEDQNSEWDRQTQLQTTKNKPYKK